MAARRGKTPPYELMRSVTRPANGGDAPPPASTSPLPTPRQADAPETGGAWGWSGVGVPLVVRVPRGVAVGIVVGLIGLLVLAYWVGHSRGYAAGAERVRAEMQASPAALAGREAPGPPPTDTRTQATQPATTTPPTTRTTTAPSVAQRPESGQAAGVGLVAEAGSPQDPREAGLNYMIVATYGPTDARDLAEFLAGEHGLETILRPVNNGRRVQVWVVDRGFTREQLHQEAYRAYTAELREVGRAWRQHRPGLRDALEEMYPARYDP